MSTSWNAEPQFSKSSTFFRRFLSGVLAGLVSVQGFSELIYADAPIQSGSTSALERSFLHPGRDAKPWVFWYWMSGNVTKEGITYDLESMARAGIDGAYIFSIDRPGNEAYQKTDPVVKPGSDLFWDRVKFAAQEADRLGMQIALNACDGWSLAGGPWITPELSMQVLASTTTVIEGGKKIDVAISSPHDGRGDKPAGQWRDNKADNYYRDIAVLAFPASERWKNLTESNWKSAQLITNFNEKSGAKLPRFRVGSAQPWTDEIKAPSEVSVPSDQVINLTDKLDSEGRLKWDVPAGQWLIQRFGYVSTGDTNRPATGARGLEADKLNPEAARVQFQNWFGEAVRRIGPELAKKVLKIHHTDSWECGNQNWSPVFRDEFIKRRGYDPIRYLPVTTGIPVGSAEESERFLWDYRRTITDLISESFFKTMVSLTHQEGAAYSSETIGGVISDSLEFYREVDLPMGEFWVNSSDQGAGKVPPAVSGAHIYGKKIIQAEAFTLRGVQWTEDPYFLKPIGDYYFTQGINRFVLHVWPHQAFPNRTPGVTLFNVFGTFFSGNQPWFQIGGHPWIQYLTRSQALLQQGIPVSDVCYFIGEELPADAYQRHELNPPLPFGYHYDSINRDALLNRATAKNGLIVLPDGVSYKLLVLPNSTRMTPEVAEKIGQLATAGVLVIGPKPTQSYSLVGYPDTDKKVQSIVSKTWTNVNQNLYPEEVLTKAGYPFDVEFIGVDMSWVHRGKGVAKKHASWNKDAGKNDIYMPGANMEYSSPPFAAHHRRTKDADIYFVTNQSLESKSVDVAFRIKDKQPELWHPETGTIRNLPSWSVREGRTYIPLQFEPAESYFIVFRKLAQASVSKKSNFPTYQSIGTMDGAWLVSFESDRGAPSQIELPELISLSDHSDAGVKSFSGVATYRKKFVSPQSAFDRKPYERIVLDLGRVKNVAEVTLNGNVLPSVWKPPFQVDITDALKEGENNIVIRVANTWKNRLLADAALPADQRVTWTLFREKEGWFNPKKEQLESSGLIGPLRFLKTIK